ncbi:MAG: nitrate reductase associated protein [Cyanobacteria bacterium J06621_8]
MSNLPTQSSTSDSNYFQFEADFVGSLQCIPMQVRMKLDNCGVKLKLSHWNQFSHQERQSLVAMPCETEAERQTYQKNLQDLVVLHTGQPAKELAVDPAPAWLDSQNIPDTVAAQAHLHQVNLTVPQWSSLTSAQRFALIKLSRPSHENKNFIPALKEFKILPG